MDVVVISRECLCTNKSIQKVHGKALRGLGVEALFQGYNQFQKGSICSLKQCESRSLILSLSLSLFASSLLFLSYSED